MAITNADKEALLKAFGFDGVVTASTKIVSSDYSNNNIEDICSFIYLNY